jgi:ribose transport system permease protein
MGGAGSEQQSQMILTGMLPDIGFWPACCLRFAVAIFTGFVNGVIITRLQIPAFIVTLATGLLLGGLTLLTTGGAPIYYPDRFYAAFANTSVLGVPAPVYVFAAITQVCAWLLDLRQEALRGRRQRVCRPLFGSSHRAVRLILYRLSGLLSGVAGFLFLTRTGYISYTLEKTTYKLHIRFPRFWQSAIK